MTSRVGTKGQVVIPKEIRDQLGLRPGDEVEFEPDGTGVRVIPAGPADFRRLRGRFAGSGMAEELLRDRRAEPR
ncbi:MAG: AbrB/MazE/SpoVT family DNA-binding domain-containing protein [Solirubrobacteraceae bacterium]